MAEFKSLSKRRSHRMRFLYFIAFIAVTGAMMALFSRSFNNRDAVNIVTGETASLEQKVAPKVTQNRLPFAEAEKPPSVKPSLDISKNPQLHVRQQRLAVYFQQAVVMMHAKRHELAVVALHKVLEIDPKMPEAHVNMGFSLLALERPKAARDFFLTALELDDSQLNAFYGLALSHAQLSQYQSAIGAIVSYIHLSPAQEPYLDNAHKKLRAWRKLVSEQQDAVEPAKG